jgi:tetratricopeptide (TPR) repeat protein
MKELDIDDLRHLRAAEGWLGLGDWTEANEELDNIRADMRAHPAVLSLRHLIYHNAQKWDGAAEIAGALVKLLPDRPDNWVNLAYATRRKSGGGIPQAVAVLMAAQLKFPKEAMIAYNLACYQCQLGHLKEAMDWLERAIDLAGKKDIRLLALDDPDLEPLWNQISEI